MKKKLKKLFSTIELVRKTLGSVQVKKFCNYFKGELPDDLTGVEIAVINGLHSKMSEMEAMFDVARVFYPNYPKTKRRKVWAETTLKKIRLLQKSLEKQKEDLGFDYN